MGALIGGPIGLISGASIGDQLMSQDKKQDNQQLQIDCNRDELERLRRENQKLKEQSVEFRTHSMGVQRRKQRGDGERRPGMRRGEQLDTTLGDLVTALIDETVELVPDEKLAHTFVAYMLADVLNNWRAIPNTWD